MRGWGVVSTSPNQSPALPSTARELADLIGDAWGEDQEPDVTHDDETVRWVYGQGGTSEKWEEFSVVFTRDSGEWRYTFSVDGDGDLISTEAELARDVLTRPNSECLPDPDPLSLASGLEAARSAGDEPGVRIFEAALAGRCAATIAAARRLKTAQRLHREAND